MSTFACTKAKMGSNNYFVATLNAKELMAFRAAGEIDEWANMGLEERLQRELNKKRVVDEIVPYLVKSSDRLFGSIIVLVFDGDIHFESVADISTKIPQAYKTQMSNMGFLTVEKGKYIILDGQHRWAAIREVIQNPDLDGEYKSDVPNDDIPVIFINHENNEKTRRIFNKLNRTAKTVSRGDYLITSEDDGYAIITRRLLELDYGPLGIVSGKDLIVNWKSNTIATRSTQLTTISTVYETVKDILHCEGIKDFDEKSRVVRPSDEELDDGYAIAERWWKSVLASIPVYHDAIADSKILPQSRSEDQRWSMLLKPVGQMAFFKALVKINERGFNLATTLNNAQTLDWSISNSIWDNVLVRAGKKILSNKDNIDLGSELMAYILCPESLGSSQKEALLDRLNKAKGQDDKGLPNQPFYP
ncbi:DNA sulfur modification protein DndB [Endozoicomonas sp. ISHI1]|uniref:DNA sulfur modification protein DndB n=1 Tax=Endozoicomonas sp. ISHI1 TaxID=2825882 RepID=UPI002148F777|nr:DNA sulfur modification protein DndB [Endozoicomonas sp. ISHI1]